ncbi:hypothetical protein D3C71_2222770 [compost metagenome]
MKPDGRAAPFHFLAHDRVGPTDQGAHLRKAGASPVGQGDDTGIDQLRGGGVGQGKILQQ